MENILDTRNDPYFEALPGLKAKIIHVAEKTYAFWEMEEGVILPEHHHIHEQVSIVTKGKLQLTINGNTTIVEKGMMALIPSNAPHSATALTRVELIDVFTPIREDFPNYR